MSESTASLPEPTRPGHVRVRDGERDEAIDLLAEAATDGRLTLDEYSERADKALTAVTRDDLAGLTSDLGGRPATTSVAVPAGDPLRAERVVAMFASETRRGRWRVPARLAAAAVFGECMLDLQDASLYSRTTEIRAQALFGSIEILVPEGVEVQMTGMSLFGSRECRVDQDAPAGAPVIEIRGHAVFGHIAVRHPDGRLDARDVDRPAVES